MQNPSSIAKAKDVASGPERTAGGSKGVGTPVVAIDSGILKEVPVRIEVRLGDLSMSIGELLALKAGSIVQVDKRLDELVELHLNGAIVALGEIVAVGDSFGVRVAEVATSS